jgi:putative transposase
MYLSVRAKNPSDFKTCQFKQEGDRWCVVLTCTKEQSQLPKTGKEIEIGIDLNSKEYVTSDGNRYQIPKYLKESQFQIKHLQRNLSRKQKGSKNRKKAQLKLVKVHQSVANKRLDYFHKLSKTLVTEYDFICLEDLDVKGIQQKMGHVVKDNGSGMFRGMIVYKAALYGKESIVIDRWYASSQLCSQCGAVHKMPLSVRTYECPNCKLVMDRDLNASKNIMKAGTASRAKLNGTNAFGEVDYMDQMEILTILGDLNEEGSHVL